MAKALLTDGLLSAIPAADACPADLCMVGKLLTVPSLCLPVSAEEVSAAPVQKQGVVVQNVLHGDAVKGGELGLFPIRCGRCSVAGCRTRPPCGRRTYPLLQCGWMWYTEFDNSKFGEVDHHVF